MEIAGHKCSVCGAPATNAARDIMEVVDFRTGELRCVPCAPDVITYGCIIHMAESRRHRLPAIMGLSLAALYGPPAKMEDVHG